MAVDRYPGTFKERTDLIDNITPNVFVQSNVSAPQGEWKPANWLPTQWQGESSKDWFVISKGKVVAMTSDGYVVPAGLRKKWGSAGQGDNVLSYTLSDKDAKVVDLVTGKFVTAAVTYNLHDVAEALLARGFVDAADPAVVDADNQNIIKEFISHPVGVAAYDIYVWAGDSAGELNFNNYQKQHLVQYLTDIQMRVPQVCLALEDLDLGGIGNPANGIAPDNHLPDNAVVLRAYPGANLTNNTRWIDYDFTNVVGYFLGSRPVARNTLRTPVIFSAGTWRERNSISALKKAGDWYLDADVGFLFFYEDGGNGVPVGSDAVVLANVSLFTYVAGVSAADTEQYVHFVGDCRPGDMVTYDSYSNLIVAAATVADEAAMVDRQDSMVGRVLAKHVEPRGLLDRVHSSFEGSGFTKTSQMPGTATKGFTDMITLTDEIVADQIVIVNIKIQ